MIADVFKKLAEIFPIYRYNLRYDLKREEKKLRLTSLQFFWNLESLSSIFRKKKKEILEDRSLLRFLGFALRDVVARNNHICHIRHAISARQTIGNDGDDGARTAKRGRARCNERARATPLVRVPTVVGTVMFLGRRVADGRVGCIPKVPVEGH